ncbi:MAG: InlB B-repeat-containing protein [Bacilli bacterium]
MKKKSFKSSILLLSLMMLLPLTGCGSNSGSQNSVSDSSEVTNVYKLAMKTQPTKTDYFIGESFDPAGGVVLATYNDKTTEDIQLSDTRLEVSKPNTETEGKKNITVKYGGKRTTFSINVEAETFIVTFDYAYDMVEDKTVNVKKGETVTKPEDPLRTSYTFDGWYTDAALTAAFDFTTPVVSNLTLTAKWLDNSKTTFDFVFDYNYYGIKPKTVKQKVEEGNTATKLAEDPLRKGYDFVNWYTAATGGEVFDFTTKITSKTTVYAKWNRNSQYTGEQTYTFEAEDVSLKGKTGKGLSGTVTEKGMIITNSKVSASNDKFIGYMYKTGLSLEFDFYSDVAVSNAKFSIRLGQEVDGYTFNSGNFQIKANDATPLDYADIVFTDAEVPASTAEVPYSQFKDFTLTETLNINKGNNFVILTVSNSDSITGTTMEAHAPLIDCIKITASDAVLDWDGNYDLPADNY